MQHKFISFFLLTIFLVTNFSAHAVTVNDEIDGSIGKYPATIRYSLNPTKGIVTGEFYISSMYAPISGLIKLNGTAKHLKDPELPNYPLYEVKMKATTSAGKVCGNWNVRIDTRMGSVFGTCTINGYTYNVSFDANEGYW